MKHFILIGLYLFAVVTANLTVTTFGPIMVIPNAFLFIGCDLVVGDRLHDAWRGRLVPRFAVLILAGSALSYLLSGAAGPVALASCVAFGLSATSDRLMYAALGRYSWYVRVNGSNVVSALVDSAAFLSGLALAGLLPWPSVPLLVAAQWLAKVAGGAVWATVLRRRRPAWVL